MKKFFKNFEQSFAEAPIAEQKALLRQVVQEIVVDHKRRIATCHLLKVPRREYEEVGDLLGQELKTHVSNVPPTGFEPVLQA